jgi:signal transduction histidine kinase
LEGTINDVNMPDDIDLQFSIDNKLGKISVDVELINKAISIVLENATRAGVQGGRQVMVSVKKRDTYSLFFKCSWLEMTITDNGPGIPNDFMPMITEPFFTTFKDQGYTGFGLSLAQKVICAHDGLLTIEQNKPAGTKVIIHLPLENYHA